MAGCNDAANRSAACPRITIPNAALSGPRKTLTSRAIRRYDGHSRTYVPTEEAT
jgi:hypothetical protein